MGCINSDSLIILKVKLLGLNDGNDLPFVLREEDHDIIVQHNIVDAKWPEVFGKGRLKKQYAIRLFFNEREKIVRYREVVTGVEWGGTGLSGFHFRKFVSTGKRTVFSAGAAWGIKEDGGLGKIYSYNFNSKKISKPVFDVIKQA